MKKKLAFIFGTRPEIIKFSPLIRLAVKERIPFISIHTGQHFSKNMSELFIRELRLPEPDYNLRIKSRAPYMQGDHTGRMMIKLEEILLKEKPAVTLVQGDTNSALSGALVTSKISTTRSFTGLNIKLGHVEAGLRSYDRTMPEEINRVIADHLSDHLFAPTPGAAKIAVSEGVRKEKVRVTGNTVVDALRHALAGMGPAGTILKKFGLEKDRYMLLTLHRQENVDSKERVLGILKGLKGVKERYGLQIIFPIHPRTVKKMEAFGIDPKKLASIIEPVGFTDFLAIESGARLIFTDSGGVQEEACVLKVPCVTLRDTTERPETVEVGASVLAASSPEKIMAGADGMLKKKRDWKNPFGDGKAAEKIMDVLL
jgi:UDP-N-acetylglucosamine 2-epimerase (non-hydrolysing)